jgi:uroporphyrinogen-III synthase
MSDHGPLAGVRVIVTRPSAQAAATMRVAEQLGAECVAQPLIQIVYRESPELERHLRAVERFDAVLLTSANSVRSLSALAEDRGIWPRNWPPVFAVGRTTQAVACERGLPAKVLDGVKRADELFQELARTLPAGQRIWFPHGNLTDVSVIAPLQKAGHVVEMSVCYETQTLNVPAAVWRRLLNAPGPVAVLLYSPSAARAYLAQAEEATVPRRPLLIAVGVATASACRAAGRPVDGMAEVPSDQGVMEALLRALAAHTQP